MIALLAAAAAAAVGSLHGRALGFLRSSAAPNAVSWSRRDLGKTAIQWMGMLAAGPLEAHAEEIPPAAPFKTMTSTLGQFSMDVPDNWRTEVDKTTDRLIFAFDFYNKSFSDYMAVRAENINLGELLLGEQFLPSKEDLVANSWEGVIQDPITKEQVGLWIMRHQSRKQGGRTQGTGGKEVSSVENKGPGARTDVVVDADIVEGGRALVFHVRTTTTNGDFEQKQRYWSNKATLRNGTISVGYVTAAESHWLSNYTGPVNGQYLDRVATSLQLT